MQLFFQILGYSYHSKEHCKKNFEKKIKTEVRRPIFIYIRGTSGWFSALSTLGKALIFVITLYHYRCVSKFVGFMILETHL